MGKLSEMTGGAKALYHSLRSGAGQAAFGILSASDIPGGARAALGFVKMKRAGEYFSRLSEPVG
jgi:hypothetical protein